MLWSQFTFDNIGFPSQITTPIENFFFFSVQFSSLCLASSDAFNPCQPPIYIYIYIQAPHLQGSQSIGKTLTLFCATYFSIIPQSKGHNSHSKHWAGFPCANCSRSLFFWALSKLLVLMTRSVHHCLSTGFWRTRRLLSKVYWSKDTHTKLFNQSLTVQSTQNFHSAEKDDTPLHWHIFSWWMQNLSPYHFSLRTSAYHRPF